MEKIHEYMHVFMLQKIHENACIRVFSPFSAYSPPPPPPRQRSGKGSINAGVWLYDAFDVLFP